MDFTMLSLFAFIWIPFGLKLVLDPKGSYKIYENIAKSPELQWILSMVLFLFAFIIFTSVGFRFKADRIGVLTWLGVLITLKAIFLLIPGWTKAMMKPFKAKHFPIAGFFALLLALAFIYIDTQLIQ